MSFTSITLTGLYKKQDGTAASGRVVFRLSSPLIDSSTNEMRHPVPITAVLSGTGAISQAITATNDPTTTPAGVTYTVEEHITDAPTRSYSIEVAYNAAGATLDLADVIPIAPGAPPALVPDTGFGFAAEPTTRWQRLSAGVVQWLVLNQERMRLGLSELLVSASTATKGPRPHIDVRAYGALGTWDGAAGADDTTAFQNAMADACAVNGVLVIPVPETGKSYRLTSTITIQAPANGARVFLDIIASGGTNTGATVSTITWGGADNTAVFKGFGWKYSHVSGVVITIPATSTGVVGWDLDVDATRTSTAQVTFSDCLVRALTGATSPIGWRMGHTAGAGVGELSFLNWENCHVTHDTLNGGIGWVNEHLNGLNYNWYGGFGSKLAKMFTNISTAGAAQATGGGSMFFYGLGASQNTMDFEFSTSGAYGIWGGRFELGTTFLHGNTGSYLSNVVVSGALIATYTVGQVFNIDHAMNLVLDNVQATGSAYTSAFLTLDCFTGQGNINVIGGGYRAPDPMWTVGSGTWKVNVLGAAILNASAQPTLFFAERFGSAASSLAFFGVTPTTRAAALTQTYSTVDRTLANDTASDMATTAATQTTPWGFASAAQADAIATKFNQLRADVDDLKQFVNALVDDLQGYGLEQ